MAERPALYRIFRLGDALTLGLVAAALATSHRDGGANRGRDTARTPRRPARRWPSSARSRAGFCGSGGQIHDLPGRDPAVGGPYAAVISGGDQIQILNRYNREPIGSVPAPNAQALAISRGWLAYLTVDGGRYALRARRLRHPANPGKVRGVASVSRPVQIGHPSLDGGRRLLRGLEAPRKLDQAAQPAAREGGTRCSGREPPSS